MANPIQEYGSGRRRFLKASAAVGVGGLMAGCTLSSPVEPAAAISTGFTPHDVNVTVTDGSVSEMGLEAIWFELEWEDIHNDVQVYISFTVRDDEGSLLDNNRIANAEFDLPESGSDTWGYGEVYEEDFANELTADDFAESDVADDDEPPLSTTDEEFLELFDVEEEGETLEQEVELELEVLQQQDDGPPESLSFTIEEFTVTVDWEELEPEGDVIEGEATPFAED